jgi:hypothetical protein
VFDPALNECPPAFFPMRISTWHDEGNVETYLGFFTNPHGSGKKDRKTWLEILNMMPAGHTQGKDYLNLLQQWIVFKLNSHRGWDEIKGYEDEDILNLSADFNKVLSEVSKMLEFLLKIWQSDNAKNAVLGLVPLNTVVKTEDTRFSIPYKLHRNLKDLQSEKITAYEWLKNWNEGNGGFVPACDTKFDGCKRKKNRWQCIKKCSDNEFSEMEYLPRIGQRPRQRIRRSVTENTCPATFF